MPLEISIFSQCLHHGNRHAQLFINIFCIYTNLLKMNKSKKKNPDKTLLNYNFIITIN